MVSPCPLISKSSCLCNVSGDCFEGANYNWCYPHLHFLYFSSRASSLYLYLLSLSFTFTMWSTGTSNPLNGALSFLLAITKCCRLADIRWSVCLLKYQKSLHVSFSGTYSGLYIYHLSVRSNFNFFFFCGGGVFSVFKNFHRLFTRDLEWGKLVIVCIPYIYIYIYIYIYMSRFQFLDKTDCISHCTNTLGKGMNPVNLPSPMGKSEDWLGYSALVRQLV